MNPTTRQEAEGRLQELAPEIARELGYELVPLRAEQDYRYHRELAGPGGEKIGISVAADGSGSYDKFHISVRFDGDYLGRQVWSLPYSHERPRADVSITKSPKTIAADIRRRVLPYYLQLLAQCQATVAAYAVDCAAAQKVAYELAGVIGATVDEQDPSQPVLDVYHSTKLKEQSTEVKVRADSVELHFSTSPEVARKVLEILVRETGK